MFSGIVEEAAKVRRVIDGARKLVIASALDHSQTKLGDSIAIDGVCLTVVELTADGISFDLAEETLRRTTLGSLKNGALVNLERSLKIGDRLHGHFVFGHVDGVGELLSREADGANDKLTFSYPTALCGLLTEKGSVSVSGISLTLGEVTPEQFSVYIIPHTNSLTKLSTLKPGDKVNLEADMLARYTKSILECAEEKSAGSAITKEFLKSHGFK